MAGRGRRARHVASTDALWLNEGTFAELDDGTLICFMREDRERVCGYKALSKDGRKNLARAIPR